LLGLVAVNAAVDAWLDNRSFGCLLLWEVFAAATPPPARDDEDEALMAEGRLTSELLVSEED
jgi:hypothetical protein